MRKIRKIVIKNFQSHKDTEINLDDYVIIHGATNSGKSAIIRAIKWCLYNEAPPEGAELTRFGEKDTEVSLYFNDGKVISRKRSGKLNEYILYDEDGVATTYTGFGRGPLKEVLDFHGMYQANLFGDPQSINIVDQQEPPFFLSEGPTARGHLISRLADTLTYETALIMLKKDAGELKKGIDAKRTSVENLSTAIDNLAYLEDLDAFLKEASLQEAAIEQNDKFIQAEPTLKTCVCHDVAAYNDNLNAANIINDITSAQDSIQEIENSNSKLKVLDVRKNSLTSCVEQWVSQHDIYDKLSEIEDSLPELNELDSSLSTLKQIAAATLKYSGLVSSYLQCQQGALMESDILGAEKEIEQLESNLSLLSRINVIGQKIYELSINYSRLSSDNSSICEKIQQKTEEYKALLLENGVCPTCFGKIDSNNLIGVDI